MSPSPAVAAVPADDDIFSWPPHTYQTAHLQPQLSPLFQSPQLQPLPPQQSQLSRRTMICSLGHPTITRPLPIYSFAFARLILCKDTALWDGNKTVDCVTAADCGMPTATEVEEEITAYHQQGGEDLATPALANLNNFSEP
ncbi:hypothetical protein PtB15_2B134 [Puccinia triticina]|nr:hypothetical protein PtB15_2B134 [Puccinia triticina]